MRRRGLKCLLDFRPPLAWDSLLAYLRLRAIPGVEWVDGTHYRRTVAIGEHQGFIAVSLAASGTALDVELSPGLAPVIGAVIVRVKSLFDLGATPDAVAHVLSQDPMLAAVVRRLPGLRVPGAFDGFELAVRAVLGQQVSVKSATHDGRPLGARLRDTHCDPSCGAQHARTKRRAHGRRHGRGDRGPRRGGSRARCLVALAHAAAERRIVLGLRRGRRGADRALDGASRASVRGPRNTSPCAPCTGRMRSRPRISCSCGPPDSARRNCGRARKAGGHGAPTLLIIYGNR